ncbi:MAG: DUF721 domain-containing protein [Puniceicoccales bacterium]|nr:DUF721 domain-containing protein [Puniceicoccales bacterium]
MIANLRGLPPNASRAVERSEKSMGNVMQRWLKEHLPEALLRLEEIIERRWPEIVGPALANYCQPHRVVRDSILFIAVANSVAQYALILKRDEILRRLQQMPECRRVIEIRYCRQ